MSVVTDVVFVADYRADADRFAALVSEFYWSNEHVPSPLEDQGPDVSGAQAFNFGFDRMMPEFREALVNEKWRGHTMLWICDEGKDGPDVWVDGKQIREAKWDL